MVATAPAAGAQPRAEVGAALVRTFLNTHAAVWLWEEGQRLAHLSGEASGYSLECDAGRLVCHFWSSEANLVRRVINWRGGAGRLELTCLRLGRAQPTRLTLTPAPVWEDESRELARAAFQQTVLQAIQREWPEWSGTVWTANAAPAGPVLRVSLRRQRALIAVAAVADEDRAAADDALMQALLLAAHLQRPPSTSATWRATHLAAVRLILPPGSEATTAARCRWLSAGPGVEVPIECWRLDRSAGYLNQVPLEVHGNAVPALHRALATPDSPGPAALALLAEMRELCPQATLTADGEGGWRFRLYGLEFASAAAPGAAALAPCVFGCGREQTPLLPSTQPLFRHFLQELGRARVPGGDPRSPWFRLQPERWLESLLGHDPSALDPQLDARFLYTQIALGPAAGRDVLDLLACDREGRLVVIELKAAEDAAFPLQALDYWVRVRQHQGDFERLGYFPGRRLSPLPPKLWLVAPALRWHPQTAALTRWLAPEIAWTRIGLNETWRDGIQVLYRHAAQPAGAGES